MKTDLAGLRIADCGMRIANRRETPVRFEDLFDLKSEISDLKSEIRNPQSAIGNPPSDALAPLREQAEAWVGLVFFAPMLQQARNSALRGNIGHGGRAEEAFGGQLDGILAERAGKATRLGLVEAIVERLSGGQPARESFTASGFTTAPGSGGVNRT